MADAASRKGKKGKKSKKAAAVEGTASAQPEAVEEEAAPTPMEEDASAGSEMEQDDAEVGSQVDLDDEFVHESKRGPAGDKAAQKKQKKQKFAPEDESKTDRDRRTIFIGNLPVETAKSKVSLPSADPTVATNSRLYLSLCNENCTPTFEPLSPKPPSNRFVSDPSHSRPRRHISQRTLKKPTARKPTGERSGKKNVRLRGVRSRSRRMLRVWDGVRPSVEDRCQ